MTQEWPPRRHVNETETDWLSRLETEINIKYLTWREERRRLGQSATEYVAPDTAENDFIDDTTTRDDDPVLNAFLIRVTALGDQNQAAVRNGDKEAVERYAEGHFFMLRHTPPEELTN